MNEQEMANWAATIPGFKLSSANGALVKAYLASRDLLPATPDNLTRAVNDLKFALEWEPGFEPKQAQAPAPTPAATPRRKDRFNDLMDLGIAPVRHESDSHAWRASHKEDTAKLAAERQAAEADRPRQQVMRASSTSKRTSKSLRAATA